MLKLPVLLDKSEHGAAPYRILPHSVLGIWVAIAVAAGCQVSDWMRGPSRGGKYATAAVCLGGHVATPDLETHGARVSNFCSDCGAKVITACPGCNAPIRGYYIPPGVTSVGGLFKSLAAYCYECGKPYPWTVQKLEAAKSLADDLDELSPEDRARLKTALDDLVAGGPKAEVGAHRIKKMVGKATTAVGKALWKMSVEIASELAKKTLLGN